MPFIRLITLACIFFAYCSIANAATFTVNNNADVDDATPGDGVCETATGNGECTLRAAITESNALSGSDTISLPAGTYTLALTGADDDLNHSGDLDITSNIVINGANRDTTIINANKIDRVFDIVQATLTLNSLTVTNGLRSGSPTDPTSVGGGINVRSNTLVLNNVVVSNNSVGLDGAGIYSSQGGGNITINNSVIKNNTSSSRGGGVAIYGTSGTIASTQLNINTSVVYNNSAAASGGGLYCSRCTISVTDSHVYTNTAVLGGGGLYNYQSVTNINKSTFDGNTARDAGGAIGLYATTFTMINSTLSGNGLGKNDGASGTGGAIAGDASNLEIYNSTIVKNSAGTAPAIALQNVSGLNIANSIVAKNISINGNANEITGSYASLGYNIFENVSNPAATDILADPLLGPLTNNGGPTPTHLPLPGSPAIDAGNISGCTANASPITTDQRGDPRPVDGNNDTVVQCDIGAVEDAFAYGVIFDKVDGLVTTELGGQAVFNVKLNAAPTSQVTLPISSSNTNEGTLAITHLTFDNSNWNTWQPVTITGVDDTVQDGAVNYQIVTGPISSLDNNFNLLDPIDLQVQNYDNESSNLILSNTNLTTTEGSGSGASFTVSLQGPPTSTVRVSFTIGDTTEGTFLMPGGIGIPLPDGSMSDGSYYYYDFTPQNWQVKLTLFVYPVSDGIPDGDITYTIPVTLSSTDPSYNNKLAAITVTNINTDVAQNPSGSTASGGGGCTVDPNAKFDPTMWLLLLVSAWRLFVRRRSNMQNQQN